MCDCISWGLFSNSMSRSISFCPSPICFSLYLMIGNKKLLAFDDLGRSKNFTLVNRDLSHFLRRWILTQLFWKRGELMVNLDPTNFFKRWTEVKTWGGRFKVVFDGCIKVTQTRIKRNYIQTCFDVHDCISWGLSQQLNVKIDILSVHLLFASLLYLMIGNKKLLAFDDQHEGFKVSLAFVTL